MDSGSDARDRPRQARLKDQAESRVLGVGFQYELPLYRALLSPALEAAAAKLNSVEHEHVIKGAALQARALLELLASVRALPLEQVPTLTCVRSLCGEGWLEQSIQV